MILYIIRHAPAGQRDPQSWPDDDLRPLTDKGRKRFQKLVRRLAKRGVAPGIIATSPLVRCRQTAEILAARLPGNPPLVELDALAPGAHLEPLLRWNSQHADAHDQIAWVGHAPDVEQLTAALIGDTPARIQLAKGAVAAIDCQPGETGSGQLLWLITPQILGC